MVIVGCGTVLILEFFKKETKNCYGYTYKEFYESPNSKQERIRFEWYLDNDAESIKTIDDISKAIDNNEIKTIEEVDLLLEKIRKIGRKFGSSSLFPVKYDLLDIKQSLKNKVNNAQG
jgi:hypothetical protein